MQVVILAGGYGTRISEESYLKPKPMIEIGTRPLLWHVMKLYSHYGYNNFIICCGYKANVIKDYFSNYFLYCSDVTFHFGSSNQMKIHSSVVEPWNVTVVDTGLDTMTGGRVKRIAKYLKGEPFMLTYGDGVSNVDIGALESFHRQHGKMATVTAVRPDSWFGTLEIGEGGQINRFAEKRAEDAGWINGGFMMLEPEILDYISGDNTILECEPLESAAAVGGLVAYQHDGFWACMDTVCDKNYLEKLLAEGIAPWQVWE